MDIILVCLMSACVFHIIYHIILLYYSFRLSRQTQGTILHVIPLDKLSKYGISTLNVSYFVNGVRYIGRYLTERDIDHMRTGDTVTIQYQPSRPGRSAIMELNEPSVIADIALLSGRVCLGSFAMSLVLMSIIDGGLF